MDWSTLGAPPDRTRLAQAIVRVAAQTGVNRRCLALAAADAFGDDQAWRRIFPCGPTEALWFISEVSDASMHAAYSARPAASVAEVIETRFDQNAALKSFVRAVMRYDLLHPVQALRRMQRTARVMVACLEARQPLRGFVELTILNLVYTGLVFVWLFDRTEKDRFTRRVTRTVTGRIEED